MTFRLACVAALVFGSAATAGAEEGVWQRLRLVVHVHTTVSTGTLSPEAVVPVAARGGLDGVLFTDSLIRRWEYGLRPLRSVVKKVVEQPSVLQFGAQRYIDRVEQLHKKSKVMLIPGVEAAPFYFWRRNPFDRLGGEIRGWSRHLMVFGLKDGQAVERLPVANDPYRGDQGAAPYQRFIDAAVKAGGVVFWAHPGSAHTASHGGVTDHTEAYPHLLEATTGYHGFAITYLGYLAIAEPGGVWDRLLLSYCSGRRQRPVWIIGESDWRGPQERPLAMVTTEVLVRERTAEAVLAALRDGRAWAVIRDGTSQPQLDEFAVEDTATGAGALVGGRLDAAGPVLIHVAGRRSPEAAHPMTVTLIRNGQIAAQEQVQGAAFSFDWPDDAPAETGFYRVMFEEPSGVLYTNPIFVH